MISIVLPCYNEERRLARCFDVLLEYLPILRDQYEIIPVDDGSTDGTWEFLSRKSAMISSIHPLRIQHAGKGKAVKTGMLFARGSIRGFMDVDLSTSLDALSLALEHLRTYDIAIGSRELDRSQVRGPLTRRITGRVFHRLLNDLVPDVHDTQCGFKFFREHAAKNLFSDLKIDGMAFDVELLYLARLRGYEVKEFPVAWTHDADSRVRLVATSLQMFMDVLDIPVNHGAFHLAGSS